MPIDYSKSALPKPLPKVLVRAGKQRAAKSAWRKTAKSVDRRDMSEETGAPICFITGRYLQMTHMDVWSFRDRAHLNPRSTHKDRRFDDTNVISVCRAVHQLIDASALLLLDKRGRTAKTVQAIDHVAWNRRLVPKKSEPCRIRPGLAVVELDEVRD